jgi:histidinol-phosphate/aromatic aminotransferase/cobyric acid decarboxylase-like protein
MRYHQSIRTGINPDAKQIGSGRNLFPPSKTVIEMLSRLSNDFLSSPRATRYDSNHDSNLRAITARLVNVYLGVEAYRPDDIFFTNGSSEAIDLIAEYSSTVGYSSSLPLPCYFAYEDSGNRYGLSVNYYSRTGIEYGKSKKAVGPKCLYVNDPCGITGKHIDVHPPRGDLNVYDLVHQMQDLPGEEAARSAARRLWNGRADDSALMLTLSKDLSLPGLRAGVLITANSPLREFARTTQMRRHYSPNPFIGLSVAVYLALLNVCHDSSVWENIREIVHEHEGLRLALQEENVDAFLAHRSSMIANLSHAREALLSRVDLFIDPVEDAPRAGYSALMAVQPALLASEEAATAAARRMARDNGLKVNPARMFGGNASAWRALHGASARLRFNLSVGPSTLTQQIDDLILALQGRSTSPEDLCL